MESEEFYPQGDTDQELVAIFDFDDRETWELAFAIISGAGMEPFATGSHGLMELTVESKFRDAAERALRSDPRLAGKNVRWASDSNGGSSSKAEC
jgi:hypothetical protein